MNSVNIHKLIVLILLLVALTSFNSQTQADITGKWLFSDSPREIEIYLENNKYYGKIIRVSGKDEKEKVGHVLLREFVSDQSGKKYTGQINSPGGMEASGEIELLTERTLKVSVKKLIFSKSFTLTRIE